MKATRTERQAALEIQGLHTTEGFARIGAGRPIQREGWPTVKRYPRTLDEIEPTRRATSRPVYASRARRFFAALAAFLLAPSPFRSTTNQKDVRHERLN